MCLFPPSRPPCWLIVRTSNTQTDGVQCLVLCWKIRCHNILQLHSGSPTSGGTYYKGLARPAVPRGVDYFLLNYDLSARPAGLQIIGLSENQILVSWLATSLSLYPYHPPPPPLLYLYRFNFLRFHLKLLLLFLTKLNLMYFSLIWKFSKLFINTNCITTVSFGVSLHSTTISPLKFSNDYLWYLTKTFLSIIFENYFLTKSCNLGW